ncbi:TPA: restriction endonuclease subunit S [Klebsiella variicola]|nr:restriction endonuclease subunit S [Klebsiella variicola]
MVHYQNYPDYRQPDLGWLGIIPSHWKTVALHYVSRLKSGESITALQFDENGEFPVYGGNGFRGYYDHFTHDGDYVLIGRQGALCGNINIARGKFFASEHAIVVNPSWIFDTRWMGYQLLSMNLNQYSVSAAQPGLSAEVIGRLRIAFPPIEEQRAIGNFLDFKSTQIDALISKQKALLVKLEEKRIALISHVVTKGLVHSVPVKNSEVEWLGNIPEHWEIRRLRFCIVTNPSKSEIKLAGEELVSFVPMESVGEYGGLSLSVEKELGEVGSGYTYFAENDVVVAKITPCFENGKGAIARGLKNGVAFGTTELHVLRAGEMILPDYLFHLTMSHSFRCFGESEMYGAGGQKRVPETFLKDFRIGLPPLSEQQDLVDYINKVNQQIDLQMRKTADMISRLTEYRSTLITNAVTGKIDVRNFSIPENCESQRTECA